MFMSCCMCEPMETAQSRGDHTHEAATRTKGRERARTAHWVFLFFMSVGGKPGPSTSARTRTWADLNVRPGHHVKTDRHKNKVIRKKRNTSDKGTRTQKRQRQRTMPQTGCDENEQHAFVIEQRYQRRDGVTD